MKKSPPRKKRVSKPMRSSSEAEQPTYNRQIAGSSPASATIPQKKRRGRKKCSEIVAPPPQEAPAVVTPEPVVENEVVDSPINKTIEEMSLFEELESVPEGPSALETRADDIPLLNLDLTKDQKAEFARLLDVEMPIPERARQLARLARFTDTKRAPVGLRAIIEINTLCGLREDKPRDDAPLFVMPEDAKVAVLISKVDK